MKPTTEGQTSVLKKMVITDNMEGLSVLLNLEKQH